MIKLKNIVLDLLNEGIKLKDVKVKWLKDNPGLTDAQMEYYWNKINAYNNANNNKVNLLKTPFSEIEKIVDKSSDKGLSSVDMNKDYKEYADENGLVVYNQNNMMIARGDTKVNCIMLGKGEKWCISRSDASNMYYGYKYGLKYPTIYYSYDYNKLKKNKDDVNGILVIMVRENGTYTVADRDNYENRGSKEVDWSYISKLQPKLKNIKSVFEYIPTSEKEKEKYKTIKNMDNIFFMDKNKKLELYKDFDYNDKNFYIEVNHKLDSEMFWVTPYDLQEKYIKMWGWLSYEDMMKLSSKLKRELNFVLNQKLDKDYRLNEQEYKYLYKNNLKDILIKYFNKEIEKGNGLIDQELEYLENNNLKDIIAKYFNELIDRGTHLDKPLLEYFKNNDLNNLIIKYFNGRIEYVKRLYDWEFEFLAKNNEKNVLMKYLNKQIEKENRLNNYEFEFLEDNNEKDIILKYLNKVIEIGYLLDINFKYLVKNNEKDMLIKYLNKIIEKGDILNYNELNYLANNRKDILINYLNKKKEGRYPLDKTELEYLENNK